jgi:hypothetical protein
MKQRRSKRRKPFRQPPKRLPPTDPLDWLQPLAQPTPTRRASNAARSETVEPILPPTDPADQAKFEGEVDKARQHEEMLQRIAIVESLLAELPNQPPGIGHNRQPIKPITKEYVRRIKQAVAVLKGQPVVPTAPDDARAAGSKLMEIGDRLGTYLLEQADVFISEATKSAGKEFGKRLVQSPFWWALATALMGLAQSVFRWLG